jgi:hypothetical protein
MRVLDAFVWLTGGVLPRWNLNCYITGTEPTPVEELQITAALERLDRFNIVTQTAEALEMNALTRELLSAHCGDRVGAALDHFEETVLRSDAENLSGAGALIRGEFRLSGEVLSELIGQGGCAMAALDDTHWFMSERNMPWRSDVSFGEGSILFELFDPGSSNIIGSRYRSGTGGWVSPSRHQANLEYVLIKACVGVARDVYARQLSGGDSSLGLTLWDDTEHRYKHLCMEPILVRGLPAWSVCGLRVTAVPKGSDLAECPDCVELAINEEHWRKVDQDAQTYAAIVSYASLPARWALDLRLQAIRAESARRLGRDAEAQAISWSAIEACVGSPWPPTTVTIVFFNKMLASVCPSPDDVLPPRVIEWMRVRVERDVAEPFLLLPLINRLVQNGVDCAYAVGHVREVIARPDASPRDRVLGEQILAEATLKLKGIEAAAPLFEAAIRSAALLPNEKLAAALEELLRVYRDAHRSHT